MSSEEITNQVVKMNDEMRKMKEYIHAKHGDQASLVVDAQPMTVAESNEAAKIEKEELEKQLSTLKATCEQHMKVSVRCGKVGEQENKRKRISLTFNPIGH